MLHAEQRPGNVVRITYLAHTEGKGFYHPLLDYNPYMGRFSTLRYLDYELTDTFEALETALKKYPQATIVNTIAHEPYISNNEREIILSKMKTINDVVDWKRVKNEGVPVIDEFGFHVYIRSDIDFFGTGKDIDYRYND